jgi:hypothetical protein
MIGRETGTPGGLSSHDDVHPVARDPVGVQLRARGRNAT